jgi:hypothetical protein
MHHNSFKASTEGFVFFLLVIPLGIPKQNLLFELRESLQDFQDAEARSPFAMF